MIRTNYFMSREVIRVAVIIVNYFMLTYACIKAPWTQPNDRTVLRELFVIAIFWFWGKAVLNPACCFCNPPHRFLCSIIHSRIVTIQSSPTTVGKKWALVKMPCGKLSKFVRNCKHSRKAVYLSHLSRKRWQQWQTKKENSISRR